MYISSYKIFYNNLKTLNKPSKPVFNNSVKIAAS